MEILPGNSSHSCSPGGNDVFIRLLTFVTPAERDYPTSQREDLIGPNQKISALKPAEDRR